MARAVEVLTPVVADPANPHTDACFYLAMALAKLGRRPEAARAMAAAKLLLDKPKFEDFWLTEQFILQKREAEKGGGRQVTNDAWKRTH